jgi:hypothetical protein
MAAAEAVEVGKVSEGRDNAAALPRVTQDSGASGDAETPRRRKHRRVVRHGTETQTIAGVSRDETGGHGTNDERLRADVPPHWGR